MKKKSIAPDDSQQSAKSSASLNSSLLHSNYTKYRGRTKTRKFYLNYLHLQELSSELESQTIWTICSTCLLSWNPSTCEPSVGIVLWAGISDLLSHVQELSSELESQTIWIICSTRPLSWNLWPSEPSAALVLWAGISDHLNHLQELSS